MTRLTERDLDTLGELEAANRSFEQQQHRGGWAKPMDCGGSNGSHHSATLAKLFKAKLADRKGYTPGQRAVWTYKINDAGRVELERHKAERRGRSVSSQNGK
jgi:hypothetical protein